MNHVDDRYNLVLEREALGRTFIVMLVWQTPALFCQGWLIVVFIGLRSDFFVLFSSDVSVKLLPEQRVKDDEVH